MVPFPDSNDSAGFEGDVGTGQTGTTGPTGEGGSGGGGGDSGRSGGGTGSGGGGGPAGPGGDGGGNGGDGGAGGAAGGSGAYAGATIEDGDGGSLPITAGRSGTSSTSGSQSEGGGGGSTSDPFTHDDHYVGGTICLGCAEHLSSGQHVSSWKLQPSKDAQQGLADSAASKIDPLSALVLAGLIVLVKIGTFRSKLARLAPAHTRRP